MFERAFVHLAVGNGDACLGDEFAKSLSAGLDGLNPVVHPEHLALAQQFAAKRLDCDSFVVFAHEGENRLAVGRGSLQQRQIADANQAHFEGARNGRGGEREHVDVHLELLHHLFVLHAETLLFVDDQQAEIFEAHAFLQQTMSADDAVDLAGGEAIDDLLRLRSGEEAAEHLDANRVASKAIGECVAVLCGEQCGGRHHGHLLAILDRLERSANGNFGLAESHVATHQTVHREGPFHVGFGVFDGLALVGCLYERKGVFHVVLPWRVAAECVTLGVDPALIQHHQLLRDLAHG